MEQHPHWYEYGKETTAPTKVSVGPGCESAPTKICIGPNEPMLTGPLNSIRFNYRK